MKDTILLSQGISLSVTKFLYIIPNKEQTPIGYVTVLLAEAQQVSPLVSLFHSVLGTFDLFRSRDKFLASNQMRKYVT
jgi:hypothetical protein